VALGGAAAQREDSMSRTIIRDCRVWDGSGKATFPADLLIEGGRIRAVARNRGQLDDAGAEVIEAGGRATVLCGT
jgi:N-acyl-D-aspartate/D-glutamate deacylase